MSGASGEVLLAGLADMAVVFAASEAQAHIRINELSAVVEELDTKAQLLRAELDLVGKDRKNAHQIAGILRFEASERRTEHQNACMSTGRRVVEIACSTLPFDAELLSKGLDLYQEDGASQTYRWIEQSGLFVSGQRFLMLSPDDALLLQTNTRLGLVPENAPPELFVFGDESYSFGEDRRYQKSHWSVAPVRQMIASCWEHNDYFERLRFTYGDLAVADKVEELYMDDKRLNHKGNSKAKLCVVVGRARVLSAEDAESIKSEILKRTVSTIDHALEESDRRTAKDLAAEVKNDIDPPFHEFAAFDESDVGRIIERSAGANKRTPKARQRLHNELLLALVA